MLDCAPSGSNRYSLQLGHNDHIELGPEFCGPASDAAHEDPEYQAATNPDGLANSQSRTANSWVKKIRPDQGATTRWLCDSIIETTILSDELNVDQQNIVDESSRIDVLYGTILMTLFVSKAFDSIHS